MLRLMVTLMGVFGFYYVIVLGSDLMIQLSSELRYFLHLGTVSFMLWMTDSTSLKSISSALSLLFYPDNSIT